MLYTDCSQISNCEEGLILNTGSSKMGLSKAFLPQKMRVTGVSNNCNGFLEINLENGVEN